MFGALISAIGLGLSAYGAYDSYSNSSSSNKSIAQANALNAKIAKQNKLAAQASVRAEELRKKQMELEGIRRRRDVIRQAQGARAMGVARANAAGASTTDSSVQAGQQQMYAQQRADTLANLQNIMIGRGIYKENMNIYKAQTKGATLQTQQNQYLSQAQQYQNQSNYAQQIFGAGLNLAQSAPMITNVYETMRSQLFGNPWQATAYTANGYPLK